MDLSRLGLTIRTPFPISVHFDTYRQSFIGQYCRVSALLELESLMSQQTLREAFSESELLEAKQKHQQVQENIQVRGGGFLHLLKRRPNLPTRGGGFKLRV